jgi:hypothetical protein
MALVLAACTSTGSTTTNTPADTPPVTPLVTPAGTPAAESDPATVTIPSNMTAATAATIATTATAAPQAPAAARLDPPPDAAALADRLSAAELTVRDPASDPRAVRSAGVELQLLLRSLTARPELDDTVLAALDPVVRPTLERLIRARQFQQARAAADPTPTPLSPTLPAWTIVEPQPAEVLLAHYAEAEALTGVPWYWLAAIHLQETRMGRIEGVSPAGAVGPMQFLPATWASCCTGDPLVARDAIVGAATYLARSGAPGDMSAALHQYNPNDSYVAIVTAYAENLRDVPELYDGYHAFQVFYASAAGTVRLPVGYSQPAPIDAVAYLAAHPADAG